MSDGRVRELERRWLQTGAIDDQVAWLRERVRIGQLLPARLELAAYYGDEGARRTLRSEQPRVQLEHLDEEAVRSWVYGLERWPQASLSLLLLLARAAMTRSGVDDPALIRAISAAQAFGDAPTRAGALACAAVARDLVEDPRLRANREDAPTHFYLAWACAWVASVSDPTAGVVSRALSRCRLELPTGWWSTVAREMAREALEPPI